MGRDYRKIKAWQMSDDLAFQIFFVTSHFPNYEKFGLALQMRRAALSVPANIVEGSTRMTRKDFAHFLSIAEASLAELGYYIDFSHRLKLLTDEDYQKTFRLFTETAKVLYGFRRSVVDTAK